MNKRNKKKRENSTQVQQTGCKMQMPETVDDDDDDDDDNENIGYNPLGVSHKFAAGSF